MNANVTLRLHHALATRGWRFVSKIDTMRGTANPAPNAGPQFIRQTDHGPIYADTAYQAATLTPDWPVTLAQCYSARRASGFTPDLALRCARDDFERGRVSDIRPDRKAVLGHGDVIRFRDETGGRRTAVVAIVQDDSMGAPWEMDDGHGPVSGWTSRAKRPGELILNADRGSHRFYDFAEACRIARRDGWNAKPYDVPNETARQRAAKAARADFERLRAWCNDDWHWCGVCLFELPRDGERRDPGRVADMEPFGILRHAALWGIESDSPDYHDTVARELVSELA